MKRCISCGDKLKVGGNDLIEIKQFHWNDNNGYELAEREDILLCNNGECANKLYKSILNHQCGGSQKRKD